MTYNLPTAAFIFGAKPPDMKTSDFAWAAAITCWCQKDTRHIAPDPALVATVAELVDRILDNHKLPTEEIVMSELKKIDPERAVLAVHHFGQFLVHATAALSPVAAAVGMAIGKPEVTAAANLAGKVASGLEMAEQAE